MKHRFHNGASQNIIMIVLEVAVVVFIVIDGATNIFSWTSCFTVLAEV